MSLINTHRDLKVYQLSFKTSMELYEISKRFPRNEQFSLIAQIRRSSRSISSNIAEAFRKRKYPKFFASKLSDSEAEAAETQNWLDYAFQCKFINEFEHKDLNEKYNKIIGMLVNMRLSAHRWQVG
ncbi:MAG: four helix bundle protein [Candidatus Marinimicrobia bacterium]|nr:four helix bundle protein [Candidatus Neomarinimicrobiota bacterium]